MGAMMGEAPDGAGEHVDHEDFVVEGFPLREVGAAARVGLQVDDHPVAPDAAGDP